MILRLEKFYLSIPRKSSNKDYHMISSNGFASENTRKAKMNAQEMNEARKEKSEAFSCTNNWKTRAFQVCVN